MNSKNVNYSNKWDWWRLLSQLQWTSLNCINSLHWLSNNFSTFQTTYFINQGLGKLDRKCITGCIRSKAIIWFRYRKKWFLLIRLGKWILIQFWFGLIQTWFQLNRFPCPNSPLEEIYFFTIKSRQTKTIEFNNLISDFISHLKFQS